MYRRPRGGSTRRSRRSHRRTQVTRLRRKSDKDRYAAATLSVDRARPRRPSVPREAQRAVRGLRAEPRLELVVAQHVEHARGVRLRDRARRRGTRSRRRRRRTASRRRAPRRPACRTPAPRARRARTTPTATARARRRPPRRSRRAAPGAAARRTSRGRRCRATVARSINRSSSPTSWPLGPPTIGELQVARASRGPARSPRRSCGSRRRGPCAPAAARRTAPTGARTGRAGSAPASRSRGVNILWSTPGGTSRMCSGSARYSPTSCAASAGVAARIRSDAPITRASPSIRAAGSGRSPAASE